MNFAKTVAVMALSRNLPLLFRTKMLHPMRFGIFTLISSSKFEVLIRNIIVVHFTNTCFELKNGSNPVKAIFPSCYAFSSQENIYMENVIKFWG